MWRFFTPSVPTRTVTKKRMVQAMGEDGLTFGIQWPDGSTKYINFFFAVPEDYAGGDILIKVLRRGAATNTAVMRRDRYRFRDAAAPNTLETGGNINYTPGDVNSHVFTVTFAAAEFQAGDVVLAVIYRLGADAGDTMTAVVSLDGAWAEYTGYVSSDGA